MINLEITARYRSTECDDDVCMHTPSTRRFVDGIDDSIVLYGMRCMYMMQDLIVFNIVFQVKVIKHVLFHCTPYVMHKNNQIFA